jgi:hypothetical protein
LELLILEVVLEAVDTLLQEEQPLEVQALLLFPIQAQEHTSSHQLVLD